jgi:lambda family phage portal protein
MTKFRARIINALIPKSERQWNSSSGFRFDGQKMRGMLRAFYNSRYYMDPTAIRARSRQAYWESTIARAAINRLVDNAVGTGLSLVAQPAWDLVDPRRSPEDRQIWQRDVNIRFWLWANSHEPDSEGRRSFGELQRFEFLSRLRDGETPTVLRYSGDSSRMSPLAIQFLEADSIQDPDNVFISAATARGNKIYDGVEVSATGETIAIYSFDDITRKFTRIPATGLKRRFLVYPRMTDIPNQTRGVGPLAAVIHELEKLTDYELAEIEAAVVNATIAAYILPSPTAPASHALSGIQARKTTEQPATTTTPKEGKIDKTGIVIQTLKAGEDLKSFDTKRPNLNFEAFSRAIIKQISAALSIPIEVLEETFNQNYSASRASLILWWMFIENCRSATVSQFLNPIYEAWFSEEISTGRIKAAGYDSPLLHRAWLAASWVGQSMPSIDPLKEADADDVRLTQGATTHEAVALKYNGSDYYDNADALQREDGKLPEPKKTLKSRPSGQTNDTQQGDANNA